MNRLPSGKKVLVCPLNWGLGHATRMVPIIRQLISKNNEVLIASDGLPLRLLNEEFPQLETINFPSYNIRYSRQNSQVLSLLWQFPKLICKIIWEHFYLRKIVNKNQIEVVISDNRFGCWHNVVQSIYITHQLMIKMPGALSIFEYPGFLFHKWFISRYQSCIIPDYGGKNNLSGDLSHKYKLPSNAYFIGPLSRFGPGASGVVAYNYDVLCILSGPEPQRTLFEEIVIRKLSNTNLKTMIIRGLPGEDEKMQSKNISFKNHLPTSEMKNYIVSAKKVICRSGYTSIMDMVALNKEAILVPTPGQTEQEYLARHLINHPLFTIVHQNQLPGRTL